MSIRENVLSVEQGTTRAGSEFTVAIDAGALEGVGPGSVRIENMPARESIDSLAKAYGLAVTEPYPQFVRISRR
jgi:hypothetical protein